jgi:hypothetical protein
MIENPFIASQNPFKPLEPDPKPAQFALGLSELEWLGFKASCARMQQIAAGCDGEAGCSTMGPDAAGP